MANRLQYRRAAGLIRKRTEIGTHLGPDEEYKGMLRNDQLINAFTM